MPRMFYIILLSVILLTLPSAGFTEIYKYRDDSGQLNFVDDESRIPAQYRDSKTSMPEATDTVIVKDPGNKNNKASRTVPDERLAIDNGAAAKTLAKHQTPVTIQKNRVLVPVKVALGNRSVKLSLLLDTGATRTVLYRGALSTLDLPKGKKYKARVAGGGIVMSEKIKFKQINVGPFKIKKTYAMVIDQKGKALPYDGMLGMDFLKSHPYQIDFSNAVINWNPVN